MVQKHVWAHCRCTAVRCIMPYASSLLVWTNAFPVVKMLESRVRPKKGYGPIAVDAGQQA